MTSKFNLLAGASVGIAMIAAGPALAKPVKHKAHKAVARSNSQNAEIEALKAQVEALTARLDAQEQNSAQATAAINNAQNTAAAAQATATQAQTQVTAAQAAVPGEVKTQLAAMPKPKNAWANDTVISGRMYFNASNISEKNGGAKPTGAGSLNGTGFDIKRFYLGIDHTFSPIFAANLTMDVSNVVGNTSNNNFPGSPSNGTCTTTPCTPAINNNVALVGRGFYIKKAYLQAKLNPALIIRLGSADLPWIPYEENQYGYRHIENVSVERSGFGTSADWGVHVLGDLAGGLLSYQFSVIDGGGYRNVKVTKSVDFEGRVSTSYKGFYAAVGGYSGKRGNDTQGAVLPNGHDLHTASRIDGLVGYKSKLFNIGGEYLHAKNWNNVTTNAEDKSKAWSVFGNVNFAKNWSVFGRYDWAKPSQDLAPQIKDHYYNAGIQWEPVKIVDLALVYKHDRADNGAVSTTNGSIGTAGLGGKYSEIGLFGQLRF